MSELLESPVALLLGLLVVALLLMWILRKRRRPAQRKKVDSQAERRLEGVDTLTGWPPQATRILSQPERRAMVLLRDALPDYMILAQVPLARFLKVPERYSYSDWMRRI